MKKTWQVDIVIIEHIGALMAYDITSNLIVNIVLLKNLSFSKDLEGIISKIDKKPTEIQTGCDMVYNEMLPVCNKYGISLSVTDITKLNTVAHKFVEFAKSGKKSFKRIEDNVTDFVNSYNRNNRGDNT